MIRRLGHVPLVAALLLAASVTNADNGGPPFLPPPPGPRLTVFISDLHLGVGREPSGGWHPFEDFRWAKEFALFLGRIDESGKGATDLILNGDTFELWQSLVDDCPDKNVGCTEKQAVARLRRVLAQHAAELRALGGFADSGENRVVLVPGNHDAALLFPAVAHSAMQAIPARSGRVRVAFEGYWLSTDGLVYSEHGHQIGEEVNRFDDWPRPFVVVKGRQHLQRPWGERFVQRYYNGMEQRYPIIDNITDEGTGIRYGVNAEGPARASLDIGQFFRFFLFQVSWAQFKQSLGEGSDAPSWDLERIRREGNQFLLESLPRDDVLKGILARAVTQKTVEFSNLGLTDDEITMICDYRALVRQAELKERGQSAANECPRPQGRLGAIAEYLLRSRDKVLGEHLEKTYTALSASGRSTQRFKVFVYSHTHRADDGFSPLRKANPAWDPLVVNTGAWQRVITPEALDALKNARSLSDAELLTRLRPEDLPACYGVILIEPTPQSPTPLLRYWRETNSHQWELHRSCG